MDKMSIHYIFLLLLQQCIMVELVMSLTNITTDQFALLEFQSRISSDPDNIISSNWSYTTSVCSWVGVSCGARHRRVTALNLPNVNLSGSLPPHLGNLSFLASFNLSGNAFQGQLPRELGKLRRLKLIDLSFNFFEGSIPLSIYNISSLRWIYLEGNSLLGTLPNELYDRLPNLEVLYLYMNQLNG